MVIHLFILPKTAEGYRTWVYLGLVVVPLALAVAILIWWCAPALRASWLWIDRAPGAVLIMARAGGGG
jgi:hypothetical protein